MKKSRASTAKVDVDDPVANQLINAHQDLTDNQINEFKSVFQIFDTDGGGTIDTQELGSAMRSLGQNPSQSELQDMILAVDVDQSGTIDFPEFLNMMSSKMKDADNAEDLMQAFRLFDKDGTGLVSAQELRAALEAVGEKMSTQDIDMVFKDVEVDPNGFINYEKLATLLMN